MLLLPVPGDSVSPPLPPPVVAELLLALESLPPGSVGVVVVLLDEDSPLPGCSGSISLLEELSLELELLLSEEDDSSS